MKKIIIVLLMLIIFMPTMYLTSYAADTDLNYVVGGRGYKQIPVSYTVEKVFSNFGEATVSLDNPQDMFIDKNDNIYILDSGHARIVVLDTNGNVVKDIVPAGKGTLKNPSGIFVDKDGDIFVADTDNGRVVHLGPDGNYIEEFTQPDSELYDTSYPFKPVSLAIDSQGQLYVLNHDDYHGFIKLNAYNEFSGYVAPTKVNSGFLDSFIGLFASELQQDLIGGKMPAVHTSIYMMEDNTFYATSARTSADQLKHFTSVGSNIYPSGAYGDAKPDYVTEYFGGQSNETIRFEDICVDKNGILSAIDGVNGRIFQYDQDGSMLAAFGGTGNWSGRFRKAIAIDVDSQGFIYVLDNAIGNVQVFKSTKFMDTVHTALGLYLKGKYEEAAGHWQEILKIDRNYYIAHLGMGKAYIKREMWREAMVEYKIIGDKGGYSQAFSNLRKEYVRKYFFLVVLIPILLIAGIALLVSRLGKYAKETQMRGAATDFNIGLNVIYSPWDGFMFIKRNRNNFSYIGPTIVFLILLISRIVLAFVENYPLAAMEPQYRNFFQEITIIIIPFFTWVIALYLVTAIMDGESKLREVYSATAYSILPLAVFTIPLALLSNIMGLDESGIYNMLWLILYIWCGILVLIHISAMNTYSLKQTILRVIISLLACIFIWCVAGLIYILLNKLFSFVYDIFLQNKLYYLG